MIKIYSYYNYGGFKDLYLGTSNDNTEFKYYIPLLQVYEERVKTQPNNEQVKQKLELWHSLSQIEAISESSIEAYPQSAARAISHSGYKMLYKQIGGNKLMLSIRDIPGPCDEFERQSPFNLMFIGDASDDKLILDKLALYLSDNLNNFESEVCSLFEKDIQVNALKINLKWLNKKLEQIVESSDYDIDLCKTNKPVILLILSVGQRLNVALSEQQIKSYDIHRAFYTDGVQVPVHLENINHVEEKEGVQSHPHTIADSEFPFRIPFEILQSLKTEVKKLLQGDIKPLQNEINQLKNRIAELEKQNKNLRNMLNL